MLIIYNYNFITKPQNPNQIQLIEAESGKSFAEDNEKM